MCHLLTLLPVAKSILSICIMIFSNRGYFFFILLYKMKLDNRCLGLFNKAILQSGTLYLSKNFFTGSDLNGFRIAYLLGMNSKDPVEVIEFLRSVPAERLVALEGSILSPTVSII